MKSSIQGPEERAKTDLVSMAYDRISQSGPAAVSAAYDRISQSGSAAVLYILALAVLYKFSNQYTALLLLITGAIAGQFIMIP